MAPNQQTASGLSSPVEPDGGSRALHALLAEKAQVVSGPNDRNDFSRRPSRHRQQRARHPRQDIRALGRRRWLRRLMNSKPMGFRSRNLCFAAGDSVDRSNVLELSAVKKSTVRIVVQRGKAKRGAMGYGQVEIRPFQLCSRRLPTVWSSLPR